MSGPLRALVIGGGGFYGAQVVEALGRIDGVEVAVAGRRGPVVLDLAEPSSFDAMDGFDVIVDAADTTTHAPDAAARRAVERGAVWLEMSADLGATERLLALDVAGPGALVVGVGIFPGISTALAAVAAEGGARAVELGVRLSPFSGAGRGNCALMRRMLEVPGVRFCGGARVETPPVFEGAALPFPGGTRVALGAGLPDAALVHRATGAPDVTCRMALIPDVLRFNFALFGAVMRFAGPLRRPLAWMAEVGLIAMRAGLLRRVETPVELVAVADRGEAGPRFEALRVEALRVEDGQRATAHGVAAAVRCLVERRRRGEALPGGVHTAPDAFGGRALLDAFEACRAGE